MTWNPLELPDQTGKTFVVTGGNAGIGYFAAEQLARADAHVVIASRNEQRVAKAHEAIRAEVGEASLGFVQFDLTSLASVRDAAAELAALPHIDGLILNAGVMSKPGREEVTEDGFPMMMGSYLGNFALVAGVLSGAHPGRIIHASSGLVRLARVDVGDLTAAPRHANVEYTRSKTAIEVFGFELDRRLRASGSATASIMTRPGMSVDSRTPARPGIARSRRRDEPLWGVVGQSKESSAWSVVRAAVDPQATGGQFFAPSGSIGGPPVLVKPLGRTLAPPRHVADRLWSQSEELTHVTLHLSDRATRSGGD